MGMLYTRVLPLCWVIAILMLAHNLYLWGGVAVTPKVGPWISNQASIQSPIAWTYMAAGRQTVDVLGVERPASDYAAKHFSSLYPAVVLDEHTALDQLLNSQDALLRTIYLGAPILLLVSVILQVVKPKPIRSFGT